jgi:hypothetical protein
MTKGYSYTIPATTEEEYYIANAVIDGGELGAISQAMDYLDLPVLDGGEL